MIVFISGPITGVDNYRSKFAQVADHLTKMGHTVINPAVLPFGLEHHQYMAICYPMVMAARAIVQLDGWRNSAGAIMEHAWAVSTGKPCVSLEQFAESYGGRL